MVICYIDHKVCVAHNQLQRNSISMDQCCQHERPGRPEDSSRVDTKRLCEDFCCLPAGANIWTHRQYFYNFLFITPLALWFLSLADGFWHIKSLKPVDELTKTAKEINCGKTLAADFQRSASMTELSRLTEQISTMISRLQASFHTDPAIFCRCIAWITYAAHNYARWNRSSASQPAVVKRFRELLNSINDELIRLSSIVESLMILVKSDTGRLVFNMQPIALNEFIEQLFEETKVACRI